MYQQKVWNAVLGCSLKNDKIILVCFQGKPFNITVIQVDAPTTDAEEAELFYEALQDLLGFPGGSVCKESACNVRDLGSIKII